MSKLLSIQGLRGIAVLAVLVFHLDIGLDGGFLGVDIFLAISGFVISKRIIQEADATGSFDLFRFFRRRFSRLFPALAFVGSITVLLSFFILNPLGPLEFSIISGGLSLIGISNILFGIKAEDYFDQSNLGNAFLHTWSLGVEVQFYALFAIVFLFIVWASATWFGSIRSWITSIVVFGGVSSFGAALVGNLDLYLGFGRSLLGFYSPLTRAWEFLIGCGIFLVSEKIRISDKRFALPLLLLLVSIIVLYDSRLAPNSIWALIALIVLGLLLITDDSPALLTRKGLLFVGDASYSIYLWHWPIIVFTKLLLPSSLLASFSAGALSLVLGALTFRFIEKPGFLVDKNRSIALGSGLLILVFAACIGFVYYQPLSVENTLLYKSKLNKQLHDAPKNLAAGCRFDGIGEPEFCTASQGDGTPIYLVGDSEAEQLLSGLQIYTSENKRALVVSTTLGCPFNDFPVYAPGSYSSRSRCSIYVDSTLAALAERPPGIVLIANSDQYFLADGWRIKFENKTVSEINERVAAYQNSSSKIFENLKASGHEIIVVETIPQFRDRNYWSFALCSRASIVESFCKTSFDLREYRQQAAPLISSQNKLSQSVGFKLVDFSPLICKEGSCSNIQMGNLVYKDSMHISIWQSSQLATAWGEILK